MALEASAHASRDPAQSRARILEAARTEFAEHGLDGARVDRIAALAGINKRMLYHYFGNKDDLFCAVLEVNYAHKRDSEKALHLEHDEPREAIRKLVALTWNYYLENPAFLSLLNSANLHQARHLRTSAHVRQMRSPFVRLIGSILDRGVQAGVFRSGVDPAQLYITIAGLSYFYLSNQHTLSAIFGRSLMSPRARRERLQHMTDVVLSYLQTPPPRPQSA
ncbi:MAG: TetR/AcrR family transcriptional regulator [Limnohabitans sp.]|jgi:AcrR family transcriptional regulator|nr:TetR/AcrR family transcriptional regulator [Limnohabitans sp.]